MECLHYKIHIWGCKGICNQHTHTLKHQLWLCKLPAVETYFTLTQSDRMLLLKFHSVKGDPCLRCLLQSWHTHTCITMHTFSPISLIHTPTSISTHSTHANSDTHITAFNSNTRAPSDSTDIKVFCLAVSHTLAGWLYFAATQPDKYLPRHGKEHRNKEKLGLSLFQSDLILTADGTLVALIRRFLAIVAS